MARRGFAPGDEVGDLREYMNARGLTEQERLRRQQADTAEQLPPEGPSLVRSVVQSSGSHETVAGSIVWESSGKVATMIVRLKPTRAIHSSIRVTIVCEAEDSAPQRISLEHSDEVFTTFYKKKKKKKKIAFLPIALGEPFIWIALHR